MPAPDSEVAVACDVSRRSRCDSGTSLPLRSLGSTPGKLASRLGLDMRGDGNVRVPTRRGDGVSLQSASTVGYRVDRIPIPFMHSATPSYVIWLWAVGLEAGGRPII